MALFGIVGVFSRYQIQVLAGKWTGEPILYGTFLINILGSLLIGAAYVAGVENSVLSEDIRIGIMVGFLGGFTTFSAYSMETLLLFNQSRYLMAAAYFILSPCLGVAAALAGVFLCRLGLRMF